MIVCVCAGISFAKIRRSIEAGATTVNEIGEGCEAGQDCGRCRPLLRSMLADSLRARDTNTRRV
jgi:bacterioferritin-associated ferredoxin